MEDADAKRPRVTLKRASDTRPPLQQPPQPPEPSKGGATLRERGERPDKAGRQQPGQPAEQANGASLREVRPEKRARTSDTPMAAGAPVTFDVMGHLFKVPSQLIRDSPDTLLAQLLESCHTPSGEKPRTIFVDSDASRFPLILDWYRYKEIHAPNNVSIEALLLDARALRLPDDVCVNGVMRSTLPPAGPEVAQNLVTTVIRQWRGFPKFFQNTLVAIKEHYHGVGTKSAAGSPEDEAYDFQPFRLQLYGDAAWSDTQNVCSAARARVLALKLEDRGYLCEFSDTDIIVTLPLRLQGEQQSANAAPAEDEMLEEFATDKAS